MSRVIAEKIAKANVGAIVQSLVDNDGITMLRIIPFAGSPGFFKIEADTPNS
jgi:hypothetical protein